jgi:hypothetical protein
MTASIEGTLALDGLLEGRLGMLPGGQEMLSQWVASAQGAGLTFTFSIDGDMFQLMPDPAPVDVLDVPGSATRTLERLLDELVASVPAAQRGGLFSTLRASEYLQGRQEQTLYLVTPQGLQTRRRTVSASTQPREQSMSSRQIVRTVLLGVLAAGVLVAVSTIFVDYRALFARAAESVRWSDPDQVQVELGELGRYIIIEGKSKDGGELVLKLRRTAEFPATPAQQQAAVEASATSLPARLAAESLARGYIRVETFDKDRRLVASFEARIVELRAAQTMELRVPLPRDRRLMHVTLTY